MNIIKFLILLLKCLEVLGSSKELNTNDCGQTPMYPTEQITGGKIIAPDEFTWLASLQYGSGNTFGMCGGSVINELYVLTAAHCVTGDGVNQLGGLTGVRLGNFTERPYCDYGTSNCTLYMYFEISSKIVHEHYRKSSNLVPHNDIALLRLIREIPFDNVLKPICLPTVNVSEPENSTTLIVAGWGRVNFQNDSPAKRAAFLPILTDPKICEFSDESRMCAGILSSNRRKAVSSCSGDSGGPLMYQFHRRQMVIEGIVSFIAGGHCVNEYYPTHYTRVRHYLNWINANMANRSSPTTPITTTISTTSTTTTTTTTTTRAPTTTITSIEDRKFPTDCGYTEMYPKDRTDEGNHIATHDKYSWLARLVYGDGPLSFCAGSVINSRYVLTSASCAATQLNEVQLLNYECENDTANCTHYQKFGIEKIIFRNNIALIRLDRPIQFGPKMKPICLPFGRNHILEPPFEIPRVPMTMPFLADEYMNLTLIEDVACQKWSGDRIGTLFCGTINKVQHCQHKSGMPLMHQFTPQRMVLMGIAPYDNCFISIFFYITRVYRHGAWLDQNMDM